MNRLSPPSDNDQLRHTLIFLRPPPLYVQAGTGGRSFSVHPSPRLADSQFANAADPEVLFGSRKFFKVSVTSKRILLF